MAGFAVAQTRRASFTIRGEGDRGKCTIEVVVDGVAQVEISGDTANLRNISGVPASWRRFECSGPMPPNPPDFRFSGVDGRGRQTLIRDPGRGGPAVVQIEDPKGGSEGYTFDITWSMNRGYAPPAPPAPPRDRFEGRDSGGPGPGGPDAYYRQREEWFRAEGWRRGLFRRVREDVEHVESVTFPIGRDGFRLARTRQDLDQLQDNLMRHRYDERLLDSVIESLARVVQDNRMSRRDRDILADDLDRMRDYRARHDSWERR